MNNAKRFYWIKMSTTGPAPVPSGEGYRAPRVGEVHGPFALRQVAVEDCVRFYSGADSGVVTHVALLAEVELAKVSRQGAQWTTEGEPKSVVLNQDEVYHPGLGKVKVTERRVPRYEHAVSVEHPVGIGHAAVFDVDLSALAPWQIDRATFDAWAAGSAVQHEAMRSFYTLVKPNIFRLSSAVRTRHLPVRLVDCYTNVGEGGESRQEPTMWILRIDRVPRELRSYWPNLRAEATYSEHSRMPPWQQNLYDLDVMEQWRLMPEHAAWHEEEDES